MKFAILGKPFDETAAPFIQALFDELATRQAQVLLLESFRGILEQRGIRLPEGCVTFRRGDSLRGVQYVISIGGDGTLLDTVTYVGALQLPILGINTGRLGFLAPTPPSYIPQAIDALYRGHFTLE